MQTLTLGHTFSDRIKALLDGRVTVPGIALDLRIVDVQRLFRQVGRQGDDHGRARMARPRSLRLAK